MIPIRHDTHSASAVAAVPKFVRCAQCGSDWAYLLVREGRGTMHTIWGIGAESARLVARGKARQALQEMLSNDCEVIPCPDCGALQPEMQPKHRWRLLVHVMAWTIVVLTLILFAYPAIRRSIPTHPNAWILMWTMLTAVWALAVSWVLLHDVNARALSRSEKAAGPNRLVIRGPDLDRLRNPSQPPPAPAASTAL